MMRKNEEAVENQLKVCQSFGGVLPELISEAKDTGSALPQWTEVVEK
jgi:hypothetical protein